MSTAKNATKKQVQSEPQEIIDAFSKTMQERGLTRVSFKNEEIDVTIESLPTATIPVQHVPAAPTTQQEPAAESSSNEVFVKSPMVGVIYVAPNPEAQPFIKVGDTITKGQDLFIVECMKTMNPVKSEHAGIVKEILVQNGKPVEYNQRLVRIEQQ